MIIPPLLQQDFIFKWHFKNVFCEEWKQKGCDNTPSTEGEKNPSPNLQNQNLLFWNQDAFLNDSVQRKKRKGYPWTAQKRSQVSFWQPWNPTLFFTGLWRTTSTVFPYVNHIALLWRKVNRRNTFSWASNISTALEDYTIYWLQRKVIFEEHMNSCFLHK